MPPGRMCRGVVRAGFLFLGLLGACTETSPTGPVIDEVVGTWVGSFTSVLEAGVQSGPQAVKLVVRTEGEGRLTAFNIFTFQTLAGAEHLYFDVTVAADGSLEGEGSWFAWLFPPYSDSFVYTGTVTGALDISTRTGSGTITVSQGSASVSIDWEVRKDTGR